MGADEIRIEDEERSVGTAMELPPKDRARLKLASWLLVGLFSLLIAAGILLGWAPADRLPDARDFFSFVKSVVPPLVTLIIGFYFSSPGNDQ